MTRTARLVAVLVSLALVVACGRGRGQDFIGGYAGDPYMGSLDVRVLVPGGSADAGKRDYGSGSAHFIDNGDGRARLVVAGNIRKPGDAGFAIEGVSGKAGWTSRTADMRFSIDKDGRISGGGTVDAHRFRFGGSVSANAFDLEVELELLQGNEGGLPAGTKFLFTYDLQRSLAGAGKGAVAGKGTVDGKGKCRKIVWRPRNIANLSGGPMQMIQVPECVK